MRHWLILLLGGCAAPLTPAGGSEALPSSPDDTDAPAGPDDGRDDTGPPAEDTDAAEDDTAASEDPCAGPQDPTRGMGLQDLLGRLQSQRCLSEADQEATIAFVEAFFANEDVWCDAVYRLSSTDGLTFTGVPELVRENASVADVAVAPDGTHVLVYNDLRPGLFADTLREDPARFWREGLVGVGGLGMSLDNGEGFVEAPLDLHLPLLALVVDPDLARMASGEYRLVTFHVPFLELDGVEWDPLATGTPHDYFRSVSPVFGEFPEAMHVVASSTGEQGGADPTVLDLPDGEIFFLGDFSRPLVGWSAPDGQYPPLDTLPDVDGGLPAAAPNAVVDPDGPYRLYYVDSRSSVMTLATSEDGRAWVQVGPATDLVNVHSPSVVRGAYGAWWLYFNRREPSCMQRAGFTEGAG